MPADIWLCATDSDIELLMKVTCVLPDTFKEELNIPMPFMLLEKVKFTSFSIFNADKFRNRAPYWYLFWEKTTVEFLFMLSVDETRVIAPM